MILNKETARTTAELLLQIKAIKLDAQEPFTWASGWKSPIYCDNRIVLSYPPIRNHIREQFARQIEELYGKPDVIAAVATGAIGIGMLVAEILSLPFIYVRPEAKSHGRKNQIEGNLSEGQTVVVIEDLISTGNSSLNAVKALKEAKANVKGMLAIFTYGFKTADENFEKEGIELHTLSDYDFLLETAQRTNYINATEAGILREWRQDPANWKNK
ncbi:MULTISPECIES: orotate phosphoribosyltransferase [Salegentibacter]|jgi:orotate phosphoribosyltransferase|uniref:Orotate phosphoribosyltransferase n=1 Tax=Salegentibacter agarivorans TaxID=345907 RepID=A0A1I2JVK6_9FLAO|nr:MULTISPECIES: orotate phosphoribosyltransferase [Salegentibacter]APS39091.1 orotate phosphoribosyltransferase [Salegentibacter sp. T436]MBO2544559.1 orotate phosphoribosyltransferase [Salegentibacter sp. BDJ18]SFF58209.1 orotate phosphoribosyltransferase [Salegentibacter agarivorans]